ncbi:beta-ketoacyl synthase chain length factor [Roseateles oligotrophus]|uniref:Beta-ketoacyl synthase chain length factor n=1 Tax=Roseateles oligotrophus TaxID=1769250 RepID=A0ABT2YDG0_9BURK|nr:beta-ketoacyl synthase chain length factor [Roseateles oligotrophus]MCV2368068.1 beta-ketoacyl synthase chain length factor [Roseateles oligotrophus]
MPTRFWIEQWAAWAPGIESQVQWRQWLAAPSFPISDGVAPLAEMPAMMRRRIEPLGRAALQTAYALQATETATAAIDSCPVVFASRWGELARSVGMLEQLALGQPLSPTAFSLSVHNAIGALYSIARHDRANYLAVSAGEHSAEAGFAEAQGLLADGATAVLLVYFDAPLPASFAQFSATATPGQQFLHAWACLLRPAGTASQAAKGQGLLNLQACRQALIAQGRAPELGADLKTLEFLIGDAATLNHGRWCWTRDAG